MARAKSGVVYNIKVDGGVKRWGTAWKNSLEFICKPQSMQELAGGYRYYINKFVPKRSGDLRASAQVKGWASGGTGFAYVKWGGKGPAQKYAHYQDIGDVYGPNKPVFSQGPNPNGSAGVAHMGWRSPVGKGQKFNTHRKMGEPFTYTLHGGQVVHVYGYTTPGTGYDWRKRFKDDAGDFGEKAISIRAGRYMYELFCMESKKTGHPVEAVGGYHIWRSWNQIKNRLD